MTRCLVQYKLIGDCGYGDWIRKAGENGAVSWPVHMITGTKRSENIENKGIIFIFCSKHQMLATYAPSRILLLHIRFYFIELAYMSDNEKY